jgi:hypothetical protein
MPHQVVWRGLTVTNPETGEDVLVGKGELLPEWTDPFAIFALTQSGGIRVVDEPDPALTAESPEPVRLIEHGPTPVEPLLQPLPTDDKGRVLQPEAARKAEAARGSEPAKAGDKSTDDKPAPSSSRPSASGSGKTSK